DNTFHLTRPFSTDHPPVDGATLEIPDLTKTPELSIENAPKDIIVTTPNGQKFTFGDVTIKDGKLYPYNSDQPLLNEEQLQVILGEINSGKFLPKNIAAGHGNFAITY